MGTAQPFQVSVASSTGAAAGNLDILEGARLVERRRDPQDRRRHAVVLTELGHTAARRFAALRAKAEERALAGLDEQERQVLVDLLNRALAGDGDGPV